MLGRKYQGLTEAVEEYLLALGLHGHSEATRSYYTYILRRLATELKDSRTDIKTDRLQAYLRKLSGSSICSASFNVYAMVIKGFFNWLVDSGKIEVNPLATIHFHAPPWHPIPPFTQAEIQRLIKAATAPLEKVTLLLLLDTGLRVSELARLRLENIDLRKNEIRVLGKGGRWRTVALNNGPRVALLQYFKNQAQENGLLWPEGWDRQKVARLLDGVGRRAGVSRVFPHRFRHTFSCYFILETNDPLALQQISGWTSLAMVQRYTAWVQAQRALKVHRQHSLVA